MWLAYWLSGGLRTGLAFFLFPHKEIVFILIEHTVHFEPVTYDRAFMIVSRV